MMPKAKLEYDLSDFEDKKDFNHALKAVDYYLVLRSIDEHLRNKIKYTDNEKQIMYLDPVREALWELLDQYQIDLYE